MIDFAAVVPFVILATAIAGPFVFVRSLARSEPLDLFRMFAMPAELPWPRGVQEEEPQPWRWNAWSPRPARPESSREHGTLSTADAMPDAA